MRITLKNFVCSLLFAAILAGMLAFVSQVVQPKNNLEDAGVYDPLANGILSEPENTIDTVFVGDSETYCAFVPLKIWQDHGITSYVCGTSSQKLYYSQEFLRKAFKNQSPKVVILETNAIFRSISYGDIVRHKAEEIFSVFRYHNRWKSLKAEDWSFAVNYTYTESSKGYLYNAAVSAAKTDGYMTESSEKAAIPAKNAEYVERIRDYCEGNGAELILVSTPSTKNWNSKRHNAIEVLAKELNIEYIDMNCLTGEINIDWSVDTRDKGDHMNYYGALKVSKYIGEYLENMGIFKDKRDVPEYDSWNTALDKFVKDTKKAISDAVNGA